MPTATLSRTPARVSTPPPRPLMIWDGECRFCGRWIRRWARLTGGNVDYAPYQEAAPHWPEIPRAAFTEAVHLIEPDGRIYRGAAAVFEALRCRWYGRAACWLYRRVPPFAGLMEALYRFVARHRSFFSKIL